MLISTLLINIGIASLIEVRNPLKIDGFKQIRYKILSSIINIAANRALRLDVTPSKILDAYHITNHSFVKYYKTPCVSTGRFEKYGGNTD